MNENSSLWHDLGVNMFLQAVHLTETMESQEDHKDLFDRSISAIKKSLAISPSNADSWNSLGIIAAHKG